MARPFLMPTRKAAGPGDTLVFGLSFPFAAPTACRPPKPKLARPRENGGSPLYAGVSPPQIGKACASYRSSPSRKANAPGQGAGKRETWNGKRGTENGKRGTVIVM